MAEKTYDEIKDIGTRLKFFLSAKGMSQSDAAALLNVDDKSITNLQAGGNFRIENIFMMASCFPTLNLNWLLTGIGKMENIEEEDTIYGAIAGLEERTNELSNTEGLISDPVRRDRVEQCVSHMEGLLQHQHLILAGLSTYLLEYLENQGNAEQ